MTTSLGKRSSINGISDIAYTIQKAPVQTSGDQFIQGVKSFAEPLKAFNNILCSGKYYGDGSKLTNLPPSLDNTKLPLVGGTLSGPLQVGVVVNESVEISEIGIRARGVNGESKLNSDLVEIHPGALVRNQLSAPSLNFNDDTSNYYVGVGTNTIAGNVCGVVIVNGSSGSSAALALNPVPTLRLEDTSTPFVATLVPDRLSINNNDTEFYSVTRTQSQFESSTGFNTQTAEEIRLESNSGSSSSLLTNAQLTMDNLNGVSCGLTFNQLGFDDTTNSSGAYLSANNLNLTGNSNTVGLSADVGLQWANNVWGGTTTFSNTGIVISGADYNTNHTISGLSMERVSTTQLTYVTDSQLSVANSQIKYLFQNNDQFMKWDCGTSFRYNLNDHHVRKDDAFKACDGGTFDFETYDFYLDDQGNAGWSVMLSNQDGGDIPVTSPDCQFYSHGSGVLSSTFYLKKFATARFTLVTSNNWSPGYAWAVSMY